MYYAQMNPKQKRIIERDVETLFTPAALLVNLTAEKIKKLGVFHPTVKIGRGLMFLSDTGVSAVRRIGDLLSGLLAFSDCVSEGEVDNEVLKAYSSLLDSKLQPNGEEFTQIVGEALAAKVKEYGVVSEAALVCATSDHRVRAACDFTSALLKMLAPFFQ